MKLLLKGAQRWIYLKQLWIKKSFLDQMHKICQNCSQTVLHNEQKSDFNHKKSSIVRNVRIKYLVHQKNSLIQLEEKQIKIRISTFGCEYFKTFFEHTSSDQQKNHYLFNKQMNSDNISYFSTKSDSTARLVTCTDTTFNEETDILDMTFSPLEYSQKKVINHEQTIQKKQKQHSTLTNLKTGDFEETNKLMQILKLKKKEQLYQERLILSTIGKIHSKRISHLNSHFKFKKEQKEKELLKGKKSVDCLRQIKDIQKLKEQVKDKLEKAVEKQVKQIEETKNKFKLKKSKSLNIGIAEIKKLNKIQSSTYYKSRAIYGYHNPDEIAFRHIEKSMNSFKGWKKIMKNMNIKISQNKIFMEKKQKDKNKKTVIFDLDETLVHCNEDDSMDYDAEFYILRSNKKKDKIRISIRPYAQELLNRLSDHFQLIVFTASESKYANQIIKILDPFNELISHKFYREHCLLIKDKFYTKNLGIIDRKLEEMVIVDNSAHSYLLNHDNAIPIIPYYEGRGDRELRQLEKYLHTLLNVKDVREQNRNYFKLYQYNRFNCPYSLIKQLYF